MTTSDGQGLNWKWLTGIAISIIGGLLILVGALINNIVSDKNSQLCAIDTRLKTVVDNQGALKETVAEIKTNQTWVMTEMIRVKEELKLAHGLNGGKK